MPDEKISHQFHNISFLVSITQSKSPLVSPRFCGRPFSPRTFVASTTAPVLRLFVCGMFSVNSVLILFYPLRTTENPFAHYLQLPVTTFVVPSPQLNNVVANVRGSRPTTCPASLFFSTDLRQLNATVDGLKHHPNPNPNAMLLRLHSPRLHTYTHLEAT